MNILKKGWLNLIICYLCFLLLSSCSSLPQAVQALDANQKYRMNMQLSINGVSSVGMAAVPHADKYVIQVTTPDAPDLVVITTCHREVTLPKQRDRFEYIFYPNLIESRGYCPIFISAYSAKTWLTQGFIDIQDPLTDVPASLSCNGEFSKSTGVSVCQSRIGLMEEISFDREMVVGHSAKCQDPIPRLSGGGNSGYVWDFTMSEGNCVWKFFDKKDPTKTHRLNSFGYNQFLPPR